MFLDNPFSQFIDVSEKELSKTSSKVSGNAIQRICKTVMQVAEAFNMAGLTIPSMNILSKHFTCSQSEILNAFLALRQNGFNYQFNTMAEPIHVWKNAAKTTGNDSLKVQAS